MSSARHNGGHPDGDKHQMTEAWKEDVRAALRLRNVSEQWLADQIAARRRRPMKRDTINKMLRKQKTSALVPDVCAILGLAPPMIATPTAPDEEARRTIELLMRAPLDVRRAVLLLLEDRDRSE